ncbi:MAG: hypothetical protein ACOCWB_03445 [Bacteroidota bacterium]
MKATKYISFGKVVAIAILILGVIHDIATFTPIIQGGLLCLASIDFNAIIYISLICGTSLILCGLLLIILFNKVEQYSFLFFPILVIGIFLMINGIIAVVYVPFNPPSWIVLFLSLIMFGIIIKLKSISNIN